MLMYSLSAQEADLALCRCEDGVDMAMQYTKMWCRYAKDLLVWMEKRISLGKCTCSREKRCLYSGLLMLELNFFLSRFEFNMIISDKTGAFTE